MDEVLIRNALNSMMEATKDDATPIIRRLARVQARAALDTLASAPAGDHVPDAGNMIAPAGDGLEDARSMIESIARPFPGDCDWEFQARACQVVAEQALAALARPRAAVGEREDRFANDAAAKAIYDGWSDQEGWVPWVDRGNSDKQEEARRLALQSPLAKVEG